ncbi:hypothetical protein LZW45_24090, partial [Escherichia coli]|uniref:hypothetical protein n=1 Tax=Escherichia coli TaxID=562 RepID=UPI001F41A243
RLRFSGPKTSIICSPMTSLKTSIKTITYLSDTGCLEIQGGSLVARMLQKIKYQDSEVLKDCLGDFFIYEQREKLRRLGVITNWGINKTADGKNNKL